MLHPRPLMRRENSWRSLDGPWQFAFDDAAAWSHPSQVVFSARIEVPYPPEAARSGIGDMGFHRRFWYARRQPLGAWQQAAGDRLQLHFGAVDHSAHVWVNGQRAGHHYGGNSPFRIDITDLLPPGADSADIAVLAEDDPVDMHKPRGKQEWQAEPHSIWYPRTSGIWRSVWIERVPAARIERLRWTPDIGRWRMGIGARVLNAQSGMSLAVTLSLDGRVVLHDRCGLFEAAPMGFPTFDTDCVRDLQLPEPGPEDARWEWMWNPEHPQLIDAHVELLDAEGRVVDRVDSYTAMRSVRTEDGRFLMNERPYALRMVLDQGYWPDGLTSADSAELRTDVELIRRLGFNGVRKHQKSEDPRFLYWADRIGLCVWAEMPSAWAFSDATVHALCDEWRALVERDLSHPCVVAWVPINESWGVPSIDTDPRHVDLVRALYHTTRALDGTRPVVGNDGWEMPCGDILSVHDYSDRPEELYARYGTRQAARESLQVERPGGGQRLLVDGFEGHGRPVMLTEFGGIAPLAEGEVGWGYSFSEPGAGFGMRYAELLDAVHACKGLEGFCYTQLTDTFLEKNGLLTIERQPKSDPLLLAAATRGPDLKVWRLADNPMGYSKRWLLKQNPALKQQLEQQQQALLQQPQRPQPLLPDPPQGQ